MKFWVFLAFLIIVASSGWLLRPAENMTNSDPSYGPKDMSREKTLRQEGTNHEKQTYTIDGSIRKGLEGKMPVDSIKREHTQAKMPDNPLIDPEDRKSKDSAPTMLDRKKVSGPSSSWEQDDGLVKSNTATRNPLFSDVYTYNPHFQTAFPVSGPPQPYLTDFSKLLS